jgi:hypothetical protein
VLPLQPRLGDPPPQQFPRHRGLCLQPGLHVLDPFQGDVQPLGNALHRLGVSFFLGPLSGSFDLGLKLRQQLCWHITGLDRLGDAAEEPDFKRFHAPDPQNTTAP